MKYHFNLVNTNFTKKLREIGKNAIFCYFGGSAGFTEASAELFRPNLTEASAEASVLVVHYKMAISQLSHELCIFNSMTLDKFTSSLGSNVS